MQRFELSVLAERHWFRAPGHLEVVPSIGLFEQRWTHAQQFGVKRVVDPGQPHLRCRRATGHDRGSPGGRYWTALGFVETRLVGFLAPGLNSQPAGGSCQMGRMPCTSVAEMIGNDCAKKQSLATWQLGRCDETYLIKPGCPVFS